MGKYLHGYPEITGIHYVPPGWDEWHVPVRNAYDYYDFAWNDNGVVHDHSGTYETDVVRDGAVDLIGDLASGDKPFFFWVNFLAPHVGTPVEPDDPRAHFGNVAVDTPAVARRHHNDMKGRKVPRTRSLNERDMSDKGPFMRRLGKRRLGALDQLYQQRLESLLSVDEAVGVILDALKRTGEYDDTLIVFASDNGYSIGSHRWVSKILGYEESARIPLLMSGPGVTEGVRRHQLVSLADLTATFVDVAGATAELPADGLSLLPLSNDPKRAADRALLLEAGGWPYRGLDRLYTGVRTADDRVLLRWWDGTEEVYDLRRDREQLDGRISASERPGVRQLRRALAGLQDCKGRSCSSVSVP
jgi:arylsulfatase A-like enzyme